MDYELLENNLVEKLNSWFQQQTLIDFMEAKLIPETQSDFKQPTTKAIIYVSYSGSTYKDPSNTSHINQAEIANVAFYIRAKKLRGNGGSYSIIREIKKCFLGYMPPNATRRMFITAYGDWKFDDNVIGPMIEFGIGASNVQIPDNLDLLN